MSKTQLEAASDERCFVCNCRCLSVEKQNMQTLSIFRLWQSYLTLHVKLNLPAGYLQNLRMFN